MPHQQKLPLFPPHPAERTSFPPVFVAPNSAVGQKVHRRTPSPLTWIRLNSQRGSSFPVTKSLCTNGWNPSSNFVHIKGNGRATFKDGSAALYVFHPNEGCGQWNDDMTKAAEELQDSILAGGQRAAERNDNRFKHELERKRSATADPK